MSRDTSSEPLRKVPLSRLFLHVPLHGSFAPTPPLRFILFDSFNLIRSSRVMHFESSLRFTYQIHSNPFVHFDPFTSFHLLRSSLRFVRFVTSCSIYKCQHIVVRHNLIHICRNVRKSRRCVVTGSRNQRRILDHHRSNLSLYLFPFFTPDISFFSLVNILSCYKVNALWSSSE
jgi:hypothetical protein